MATACLLKYASGTHEYDNCTVTVEGALVFGGFGFHVTEQVKPLSPWAMGSM